MSHVFKQAFLPSIALLYLSNDLPHSNACLGLPGSAWETPFALYAPKKDGQVDAASGAYVLGLQLPLKDVLRGGGIEFILKRDRQPEWVSNADRRNFFVSLAKVRFETMLCKMCNHLLHESVHPKLMVSDLTDAPLCLRVLGRY